MLYMQQNVMLFASNSMQYVYQMCIGRGVQLKVKAWQWVVQCQRTKNSMMGVSGDQMHSKCMQFTYFGILNFNTLCNLEIDQGNGHFFLPKTGDGILT